MLPDLSPPHTCFFCLLRSGFCLGPKGGRGTFLKYRWCPSNHTRAVLTSPPFSFRSPPRAVSSCASLHLPIKNPRGRTFGQFDDAFTVSVLSNTAETRCLAPLSTCGTGCTHPFQTLSPCSGLLRSISSALSPKTSTASPGPHVLARGSRAVFLHRILQWRTCGRGRETRQHRILRHVLAVVH